MRRVQIRKLFNRHHGSIKRVADEIGISTESVSKWLRGETTKSQRIEIAALREAQKLLDS